MNTYILRGHDVVQCTIEEWMKWFETNDDKRRVALTTQGNVTVSTVFLGIDLTFGGPPLIFETMIFGGEREGYQKRYSTWLEAEEGHKNACTLAFILKLVEEN